MPSSAASCYFCALIFGNGGLLAVGKRSPQNCLIPGLCIQLDWGELGDGNPVKHIVRLTQGSDGYTAQAGNLLFNSHCRWVNSQNERLVSGTF